MSLDQLKDEIIQVELVNGLAIVGKFVKEKDDTIQVRRAYKVIKFPPDEQGRMAIRWIPFPDKDIFLYKHAMIMIPVLLNEEMKNMYIQQTSNLTIPKAGDVRKFKMGETNKV